MCRSCTFKRSNTAEDKYIEFHGVSEGETKKDTVETAKKYILSNWPGIMQWVRDKNKEVECSGEGHVSHIYADRMSFRPLGWSRKGADRMSRLRVYERNGGSMLALVKYQKEALPKVSDCGEVIYSSHAMFSMERKNREALGGLADMPVYSIP